MNKKILIVLILFLLFPTFVKAEIEGVISGNSVRIRSTPTVINTTNILFEAMYGEPVMLVDTTKYNGDGCNDGWYKININSKEAYVCSTYVSLNKNPEYNTSGWTARTYTNMLNVRSGPGTSYSSSGTLLLGANLTILETSTSGNGCTGNWYKVRFNDGRSAGYICSDFIVIKNNITAKNEEYEKELRTLGFPESYFPYLSYLHSKFPNWKFNPIQTNLKWNDVLFAQTGKNYIQSSNENFILENKIVEVPNWYRANTGVISFYMDPRNFLNERYIYMFENLGYDSNYENNYPSIIKDIFAGGTFNNDEFANLLNTSGKTYNISPAHLASRIRQEVTINGNAATSGNTFTWEGVKYSGYYNYFNIGAYGTNPLLRGLAYAAGLVDNPNKTRTPWNTREKAINGGSSFLSSAYISKGQNTLYFQKFNTSPNNYYALHTHQYMTNIQAPSSEAYTTYKSYLDSNLISNTYIFSIPIYLEMPPSTSLPSAGSKNNYLSDLSINEKLIFGFDKDVLEYTYFIDKNETSITIKGTPENTLSIVKGDGIIPITNDTNEISIVITAENGEIKTYKVNVIKVESITSISDLSNKLGVINNNIIPNKKINTQVSLIVDKINSNSPSSIIEVTDKDGNKLSLNSNLKTGTIINVTTTSNETITYKVAVTGDVDGDGLINILDLLKIQKHILKSKLLDSSYLVAGDTNNDKSITILDLLRIQKHILGEIKL